MDIKSLLTLIGLICGMLFALKLIFGDDKQKEVKKDEKKGGGKAEVAPAAAAEDTSDKNKKKSRLGLKGAQADVVKKTVEEVKKVNSAAAVVGNVMADSASEDDYDDEEGEGRGGKKDAKRREKREAKEAAEALREQKNQNKAKKNEAFLQREAERHAREEEQRLKEEKEREEKEKKEKEDYDKWKHLFQVEDGGSAVAEQATESQGLLGEFVEYIKKHKVVVLDDLAVHFNLKPKDVANRVKNLEEMGRISGVTDDRGKFIYISEEELTKVAKFIEREGRLSLTDIANESNKLITLTAES